MDSAIDRVNRLLTEGERFSFENFSSQQEGHREFGGEDTPEWHTWKTRCSNFVHEVMAPESAAATLVDKAIGIFTRGNHRQTFDLARSSLLNALTIVRDTLMEDTFGELRTAPSRATSAALSNKVFVVHGHDQRLTTDVERFLHELHLEPIVLHRQPDRGMTLIEKFEEYSDVGYAIVLLTPDEVAYLADLDSLPDQERSKERRARPNVIFEFGFLVGKLGRDRVCCLHREGVELPSDLRGLVYKEVGDSVDSQAYSIVRELKAAGYKINI